MCAEAKMGRRILAFFLGMIFGWVILLGGIVLAAAIIKPSTFGVQTDYVSDDGQKFDNMSLLDIVADGVKLINGNNLTMNSIKSTYGVDLIDLLGLDSQSDEFDELKSVNFADVNGLSNALGGIKLSTLAPLFNGAINDDIILAWKNNPTPPTVNDLASFDIAKVLGGVTLRAIVPQIKTTGIEGIVSAKDLGQFVAELNNGGDAVSFLLDGAKIGDVMNFTYDTADDTWLNGSNPVSDKLVLIVADVELSEITGGSFSVATVLEGVKVGEIMGYEFDEPSGKWFENQNEITDKLKLAVAKIEAIKLTDGSFSIEALTDGLKAGDVLGFVFDESTGKWLSKDGQTVTDALTEKFANLSMSELLKGDFSVTDVVNGLKIGDVMGYSYDQSSGKWFDGDREITDKLTSNLADRDIQTVMDNGLNLTEIVGDMKVGELMGYSFDADENKWYNGQNQVTDTLTLKLIEQNAAELADGSLDFMEIANEIKLGELMGYDFSEDDGKWFDNEAEITDRLTLNLASKTLGELTESGFNFDSLLEGVTFGSLFNVAPSSSVIMQKLKDTEITKLEEKLNEMYLGDLLDFHRREINTAETVFEKITPNVGRISATGEYIRFDSTVGKWFKAQDCKKDHGEHTDDCFDFQFYDEEENEAGGINNIISNMSVSNLETSDVITEIMALPLSEFFGTQQKGVLSLLDSDPSLSELPSALTHAVNNATMGSLLDSGVIELQCADQLDAIYQNDDVSWRDLNITAFVDSLVQKLAELTSAAA